MHCGICEKSFHDRNSLAVHKNSHKEQSFRCYICQYSSNQKCHLESHIMVLTDQNPFQCDQCDQGFSQKKLLKKHVNVLNLNVLVPAEGEVEDNLEN